MKKLLRLILVICIFSFSCFVASCNEERVAVPTDLLFRIETIDVDGVDYAVKRGFAIENVKLVNEKEQLEDFVGEDQEIKNYFSDYLNSKEFFQKNALALVPFVDNEKGNYTIVIDGKVGAATIIITRELNVCRNTFDEQKLFAIVELPKDYVKTIELFRSLIYDKYLYEDRVEEFSSIPKLFEQGEFSRQDLIDVAWNTNNAKNNPEVFTQDLNMEGRNFKILKTNIFNGLTSSGYIEYLYKQGVNSPYVEIYKYKYYGYYSGYFLFSFTNEDEYPNADVYNFTVDEIVFRFASASPIYAIKEVWDTCVDTELTLKRIGKYTNRDKSTLIDSREEWFGYYEENGFDSLTQTQLDLFDENFFADNTILTCFGDFVGIKIFDGKVVVYLSNDEQMASKGKIFVVSKALLGNVEQTEIISCKNEL